MKIHPLRSAYITLIQKRYGAHLRGDGNPERTEVIAQRVMRLGLDYDEFVDVATSLWHVWADEKGWPYPYWNVITSDITFERIQKLLNLSDTMISAPDESAQYEAEAAYAFAYVHWMLGRNDVRPRREIDSSIEIRVRVAEYICSTHGLEFITSDLNSIAKQLEDKLAS